MRDRDEARDTPVIRSGYSFISADGQTPISVKTWHADMTLRGVVQIIHGMVEFIDRYDEFASYLARCGYLVVGCDLLAHGGSVTSHEQWGNLPIGRGIDFMISDIDNLRRHTQEEVGSKVPYFIIGHSMGSFLLRKYIASYGNGLAGAIICGTAQESSLKYAFGYFFARLTALFRGSAYRSTFLHGIAEGAYNKHFKPSRTPYDWLSKNEASIDAYASDPRDTFLFTAGGYCELMSLLRQIVKPSTFDEAPDDLPLFVIAGADDPVGDFGKAPQKVAAHYRRSSCEDVTCRIYTDDRHEILNELDRDKVYANISTWLEDHLTDAGASRGNQREKEA